MTRDDVKESASDPIIKPETTRRRRASSNLGGDPRGDTGVASLATFSHENRSLSDIAVCCHHFKLQYHILSCVLGITDSRPQILAYKNIQTSKSKVNISSLDTIFTPTYMGQPIDRRPRYRVFVFFKSYTVKSFLPSNISFISNPPDFCEWKNSICKRRV